MHSLCLLCHSLGILFHNFQYYFRMGANVYLPQVSPFQISHIPNSPATEYFVDFSSRLWFPSTWPVQGPAQFRNPLHSLLNLPPKGNNT